VADKEIKKSLFKRAFRYGYVKSVNREQLLQDYDDTKAT